MKKIAVVAREKAFAQTIEEDLNQYFADYAQIHSYSLQEIEKLTQLEEECVVMSALTTFQAVQPKMKESASIQVLSFALGKENLAPLYQVPTDQKVLIANVDYKMCMQVAAQIYEAGYHGFHFIPYYGDEENRDMSIKVALTPNELKMVPPGMEQVINIGERPVDPSCIVELAGKLGIEDIFSSPSAKKARDSIVASSYSGIDRILGDKLDKHQQMSVLIELIEDAIVITDAGGMIMICNQKAKNLMRGKQEILDVFPIADIIPGIRIEEERDQLVEIEGENIIVTIRPIISGERYSGNIITMKNFEEAEERQHGMRSRIVRMQHEARYDFTDIIGKSEQIQSCISLARKMAQSDSTVLITGESGTGKEVFAQSIHRASGRSRFNFVALNCAAIPEHLLESELFGYEEGAFTGAKKGGKIGYFELAHKGTIFLDEIGEMPLSLQSKILRVLEEKAVARIGSNKLIDIDVRVIAATNRDLWQLTEEKRFREDLYYRLNVLPLEIPPLRQRKGDVFLLLSHMKKQLGKTWELSEEAAKKLEKHPWKGNVRELKNTAEYLSHLDKAFIEITDLPAYIVEKGKENGLRRTGFTRVGEADCNPFILSQWKDIELFEHILLLLEEARNEKQKLGRRKLEVLLEEKGFAYTEGEIRTALRKLADGGYIKSQSGRGGSVILGRGEDLLEEIKGLMG